MTDFFLQDVGITQFQFNVGQQLLSAGIVLLEVRRFPASTRVHQSKEVNQRDRFLAT